MKLTTAGIPSGFDREIVGIVTRAELPLASRVGRIIVTAELPHDLSGYLGAMTTSDRRNGYDCPTVHRAREIDHLHSGDIVVMEPASGFVRSLYRPADTHNSIFVTERCNSNCIMCSQPPKDRDDTAQLYERNAAMISLIEPLPAYLTITGGEPTLLGERLCELVTLLRHRMPETNVHILTNGRRFAWPDFTRQFAEISHHNLSLGIPLYSDLANDHDYVVQAKDAFDQTIMGLQNLGRWNQRIEIRIVLHARTVGRLPALAEFIYRNLTFVEHIAIMGLENIGYAPRNMAELWVDPNDYQKNLSEAVTILRQRSMQVSIYNHQLCVLDPFLWQYAKKSISDWKNIYLEECMNCAVRDQCGGFFKWASKLHSAHIRPIVAQAASGCTKWDVDRVGLGPKR